MKNIPVPLLIVFFFAKAGAQSKTTVIKVDKQLLEYRFLNEGGFYLQFGKITSMMEGPRLNKEVMVYSDALEKNASYDLKDIALKVQGYLSPDGKFKSFKNQASTAFSDEKVYYVADKGFKSFNEESDKGPLKDVINIITSDNFQVYFGKQKKRKDKEALNGEDFNDLYLHRRDTKTFATKLIPIKFPVESFPNGRLFYQYQDHTNEKVWFMLNELAGAKENHCVLVSYDYEGKIVDTIPFIIKLDNAKDLMFFNGSDNNIVQVIKGGMERQEWTEGATIATKIAKDGFYAYGKYGVLDGKKTVREGIYVYKFNFEGKMLWKLEKDLINSDKKKMSDSGSLIGGFGIDVINGGKLALWSREERSDSYVFYQIDGTSGKVVSEKSSPLFYRNDFEWSRKMAFAGLQNAVAAFGNKKSAKNEIDVLTAYGMANNAEMAAYINGKTDSKFESHLCPSGIYTIEENHGENVFRLLKFDWN